jgi:hypothetical protein
MDELIEFAETLAFINNLSETELLNEESLEALVEILHCVDYFPSSTELIEAFGDLNLEDMDSWSAMDSDFFEGLSVADEAQFLEGLDAKPLEVKASFNLEQLDPIELANFDFAATYAEAEAVTGRLNEALSSIPEPFQKNLGSIDWTPSYHPIDGPQTDGVWTSYADGRLPDIKLFDHAEQAESVLYHEIGHHIIHLHPNFLQEFMETSLSEPDWWDFNGEHLTNYSDINEWDDELFAESIMQYKTQPEILQNLAPRTFEVIDRRWQDALAAQIS